MGIYYVEIALGDKLEENSVGELMTRLKEVIKKHSPKERLRFKASKSIYQKKKRNTQQNPVENCSFFTADMKKWEEIILFNEPCLRKSGGWLYL